VTLRIGIAGWSIPREHRERIREQGSHLERYASRFNAVEINSSFYRPHQPQTYARWAATVPADFRFSVKIPKEITHELGLKRCKRELQRFIAESNALGKKLSVLLVQLPPSLVYEQRPVRSFFSRLRGETHAHIVCEPRHASWFEPRVSAALNRLQVARAAVDPSLAKVGMEPAGDQTLVYFRLHGSPRIYYSKYDSAFLRHLNARAQAEKAARRAVWCIFDNTAQYAAWDNALELEKLDARATAARRRRPRRA
jgi:uncharacterized protein YecE (DUF72 family)